MSILPGDLSIASRTKIYVILGCISLPLLFLAVSRVAYVLADPADLLGLASHFPATYWIGLAALVLCAVFAFLDTELRSDGVYLFILLALGLYLFGIASMIQENVRHPTIYYNLANVRNLLATGHIEIAGERALALYGTWPAAQLTYASVLQVTSISLEELMSFMPYFWLVTFTFITYLLGRRLGLPQNTCFLLSFLAISSYWVYQSDASQQGVVMLLYLLGFALLVKPAPRYTAAEAIVITLCLAALVLTHGVTSLSVLVALVVLSAYRYVQRRRVPFLLLFATFWLTWYVYQAYAAFELGVMYFWAAPWDYILRMGVRVEGLYQQAYTTASVIVQKYASLAYYFVYGAYTTGAVYLLLRRRLKQEDSRWVLALLMWSIGLALIGFAYPNREVYVRSFIMGLVPIIAIILKVFSSRRLLVPLMLICILLFLPARYGLEAFWGQMPTSELAGLRFFGDHADLSGHAGPEKPWFFYREGDVGALSFFRPEVRFWRPRGTPSYPTAEGLRNAAPQPAYVIGGMRGSQGPEADIVNDWVRMGGADEASLIYTNGNFRIYRNTQPVRK